jgi:aromatic-L-amino-acid/L-tryptophan decarboxylase
MRFDFDSTTRRDLGHRLIDLIDDFYASLPDRKVQLPIDERAYGPIINPLPELGEDPRKVLDEVFRDLVDKGFHVPAANYFGLMNPTPTYVGVLAEALVAGLNPQLATLARSQLASKIEIETVRWIGERVEWPTEFNGTFTSGGNEANFSALALALAWKFPRAIEEGVASIGAQPVVYASAESHHSLDKSAGLLGIGRKALRRVPVNARLQMDPTGLSQMIREDREHGRKPFCVVATAGTTNSGVVDDLKRVNEICRENELWLHVDGAYGGAVIFSNKHRHILEGIEQCDSLTIDPHKWLAVPFAAGVILTRHPEILDRTFAVAAPYMPKASGAVLPDNSRISTQWTRRMNSLKLWLTLRVHGRQAYEELIDRQMMLAQRFATWLETSPDFELASPLMLPIVNFRLRNFSPEKRASAHRRFVEQITADGTRWISETVANDESVLRMMVISYLTEERHVRDLEDELTRVARALPVSGR